MLRRLADRLASHYLPRPPVRARHSAWSIVSSADDLGPAPTAQLIGTAWEAVGVALHYDTSSLESRAATPEQRVWLRQWPGEHYVLLAALAQVTGALRMVEVGTSTGLGTLALLDGAPVGAGVTTYDVLPWERFTDTCLTAADFANGRVEQRLIDISDPKSLERELPTFEAAQLVFFDAPKDGRFEQAVLPRLAPVLAHTGALLVLDDIRLLPMTQLWRDLALPKLDLTSFGHWSGTGLAAASQ